LRLRVLIHNGTHNLGDAMQTVALCSLLGRECEGVYRDLPHPEADDDSVLIVYGWCGWFLPQSTQQCLVSGIHVGVKHEEHVNWLRCVRQPIGVRDPYTHNLLRANRIASTIVGCATLTLPRYRGPRTGRLSVNVSVPGTTPLTNTIANLSWADEWRLAIHRLDELRRAEVVYTNRLHVLLPCLAFGTPVVFPLAAYEGIDGKERLTLFEALGCEFDVAMQLDVGDWAERYCRFLSEGLHEALLPTDGPTMPTPLGGYSLPYVDAPQLSRV
jgi:hypothetical protein